jgi:hypothetical protein
MQVSTNVPQTEIIFLLVEIPWQHLNLKIMLSYVNKDGLNHQTGKI